LTRKLNGTFRFNFDGTESFKQYSDLHVTLTEHINNILNIGIIY